LEEHFGLHVDLYSATSYKRLREEALEAERWSRLHPREARRVPYVTRLLADVGGPVIAVTDYMKAVPDSIGRWVPGTFIPLGTDGYGRSDTREALRRFFEIDAGHVVTAVLSGLASEGKVDPGAVEEAIKRYDIDPDVPDPLIR
jgi:pyruvate dehydrogenase E1 component